METLFIMFWDIPANPTSLWGILILENLREFRERGSDFRELKIRGGICLTRAMRSLSLAGICLTRAMRSLSLASIRFGIEDIT